MRAVRLGDGVERAGFDYGRQIDFGAEGAFRIDRAGRVSSDVHRSLLELETSPCCAAADLIECFSPTGNIATLAQKIVIFTAASYLWDDAGSQRPLLFRSRRRSWRVRRRRPDAGPSEVEAEPPHPAVGGAAGRA